jgi:small subunit ribosomal protein S20
MPITKGGKKALRTSEKKKVFNLRRKKNIKSEIKKVEKFIKEGKVEDALKELPKAYKALDKGAKMNTIKKNTASRKKSRLAKSIKKISVK